jgi:hypothetical protein
MNTFPKLWPLFVLVAVVLFCTAQEEPKAVAKQQPSAKPQAAAEHQHPPFKASPEFDRLRKLAGRWEGTSSFGPVVSTFRVTADGSAVVNVLAPDRPEEMLTIRSESGRR